MKKIIIGLLLVGFAQSIQAQHSETIIEKNVKSKRVKVINKDYITEVQNYLTPQNVRAYEGLLSKFDVTKASDFDGRNDSYRAVFKYNAGTIDATFNSKGELVTAEENFVNVWLPKDLEQMVKTDYTDWTITKNEYVVQYNKYVAVKSYYKIYLKKGRKTKNVKIEVTSEL